MLRGTKKWKAAVLKAFPDYHTEIEDEFTDGDRVVIRWRSRGTHQGEFQGIAPTGRQITVTGITISRIAEGKIADPGSGLIPRTCSGNSARGRARTSCVANTGEPEAADDPCANRKPGRRGGARGSSYPQRPAGLQAHLPGGCARAVEGCADRRLDRVAWSDPLLVREATVVERNGGIVGVIVTGLDHPPIRPSVG